MLSKSAIFFLRTVTATNKKCYAYPAALLPSVGFGSANEVINRRESEGAALLPLRLRSEF